jgi:hypothetical protein
MCLTQNLKAVTMGMVTAIAFFWSNKPNPAITAIHTTDVAKANGFVLVWWGSLTGIVPARLLRSALFRWL